VGQLAAATTGTGMTLRALKGSLATPIKTLLPVCRTVHRAAGVEFSDDASARCVRLNFLLPFELFYKKATDSSSGFSKEPVGSLNRETGCYDRERADAMGGLQGLTDDRNHLADRG